MAKNMKFICHKLNGETPLSAENLNKMQSDLKADAESTIQEEIDKKHKMNDNSLLFKESDIITITPLVGTNHENFGGSYYYKIGTKVHVHLGINLNTDVRSVVFNMPAGYRPQKNVCALGGGADGHVPDMSLTEITESGQVWAKSATKFICVDIEYDAFK